MGFNAGNYMGLKTLNCDILKTENILGKEMKIKTVSEETFPRNPREGETLITKLALHFKTIDYILPLNNLNIQVMVSSFGDDTDKWIDKTITMSLVKRKYMYKLVDGIKVNPLNQTNK